MANLVKGINSKIAAWSGIKLRVARDQTRFLAGCGVGVKIGNDVEIQRPDRIRIGDRVTINKGSYLAGDGGILIGDDVLIGPYVCIYSLSHIYDNPDCTIRAQGYRFEEVIIEDDVWVGGSVTLLAGVKVGKGAVVAACSLVNKDVDPYAIVGGVPARVLGRRGE